MAAVWSWFTPSGLLLAAGTFKADHTGWVIGWCQKGNSNNSLPWPVSPTAVVPSSTIYCSWQPHTKQKAAPAHSSAYVTLTLCYALGLRWPGWLHDCSHTHLGKRHTHIHDCSLRFTTIIFLKVNFILSSCRDHSSVQQLLLPVVDMWLLVTALMSSLLWFLND